MRHDDEDQITKIAEATNLLRLHDPRRFNRMARHIPLLIIADHSQTVEAAYHHFAKAVMIRASALAVFNVQTTAAVLAHEETHARLESPGFRHTTAAMSRIEQLCLRNEIWFLEKVPGAEALAEVKRICYRESAG